MAKQTANADSNGGDAPGDVAAVQQDIEALRADLASLIEHMKGLGETKLGDAANAGSDAIEGLRSQLEQTANRLGNQGRVSVAEVERTIRERPLTALLAAFGAGLLLARLWDRR